MSHIRGKRLVSTLVMLFCAVGMGLGTFIIVTLTHSEKIDRVWTVASVDRLSKANVTEVINYDFGSNTKHGIYRVVPGLDATAAIKVSSPDAPDQAQVTDRVSSTEIRVGDPEKTISGQHRYQISYPLSTLATSTGYAWNAHGTEWNVGARDVEAHLIAPYELTNLRCFRGAYGSEDRCSISQPEPGHVVAVAKEVDPYEGVTVYADRTATPLVNPPSPPVPPASVPERTGIGRVPPTVVALVAGLAGLLLMRFIVRRMGRERIATGGAADVAWAVESPSYQRIDAAKLSELATIEFAPPKGLTPAQGGVLITETVDNNHQTAWIMQASIDGYLEVEGSGKNITLKRNNEKSGYADTILDQAFHGRDELSLAKYDSSFKKAWTYINVELQSFHKHSGLWDPSGDRRVTIARVLGVVFSFIGIAVSGLIAATFNSLDTSAGSVVLFFFAISIFVTGLSLASVIFSWELRVRTPQGSGLWLRTESFRRFLNQSEAKHVEFAAEHNMLREYTAWAVALGEVERWTKAMQNASLAPEQKADSAFFLSAPYFAAATSHASSPPSSSGSSGGGGGFSGGGGGGGGGGSW